jgi:hypothetical protein
MMLDHDHTKFRCDRCGASRSCDPITDSDGLHDIGDGRDLCGTCFDADGIEAEIERVLSEAINNAG